MTVKYPENINAVSYIGRPRSDTAMFIVKKVEYLLDALSEVTGCLVFAESGIEVSEELMKKHTFVFSDKPQKEYSEFAEVLYRKKQDENRRKKYTLTEEGYYLGENVRIGKNAYIEPGCVIGHDVVIGDNAEIYAGAVIKNAVIGDNFILKECGVVGSDGFTLTKDDNGNWIRTPSMGGVVVGNNVEIGVNANISQGTADATYIEDYVKLDALIHVGHDAVVEFNTEVSAGGIIGGYVETGEYTSVGINASIRNRLKMGDNTTVGMAAVVTKPTENDTTYIGNPARAYNKE